jgi:hypothetical protein
MEGSPDMHAGDVVMYRVLGLVRPLAGTIKDKEIIN